MLKKAILSHKDGTALNASPSFMEGHRLPATKSVGFCLLSSELIEYVFIRLASPDICRLRCVSKPVASILCEQEFVRDYNDQHRSSTWLFFYNKPANHGDAALYGFTDCSNRWCKILVHDLLKSVVHSGKNSSWLTRSPGPSERFQVHHKVPMAIFPRGDGLRNYCVIGDGKMVIVRSDGVDDKNNRVRMLKGVELWGLTANDKHWQFISETSREIVAEIKKPYAMIKGCLEERNGTFRVALMSNFQGVWDIIWLSYDIGSRNWSNIVLPNCQIDGSSMVGVSFSSGLVLS
ncbi:hypothetical protein RJ639_039361 [Escallonia herrerae]|uniref:F-box domain-containing protein n=1 Tax=Escallonia herrerae TaxID=1293975 RepID=A0AA88WVL6_9ASTE|nr:hypothetical protein RJ639_039361 [Escallonia herrerae]